MDNLALVNPATAQLANFNDYQLQDQINQLRRKGDPASLSSATLVEAELVRRKGASQAPQTPQTPQTPQATNLDQVLAAVNAIGGMGNSAYDTQVKREQDLADKQQAALSQIFGNQQAQAIQNLNQQFILQQQRLQAELAAKGILSSPVSLYQENELNRQKNQRIADIIRGFGTEQAQAGVNLGEQSANRLQGASQFGASQDLARKQLLANIFQRGQGLQQEENQFQQNYGLGQKMFDFQKQQAHEEQNAAREAGNLAAQRPGRDWSDWLGLGLQGLGTAALVSGTPLGVGIGAGIGALGSGIGSIFRPKFKQGR